MPQVGAVFHDVHASVLQYKCFCNNSGTDWRTKEQQGRTMGCSMPMDDFDAVACRVHGHMYVFPASLLFPYFLGRQYLVCVLQAVVCLTWYSGVHLFSTSCIKVCSYGTAPTTVQAVRLLLCCRIVCTTYLYQLQSGMTHTSGICFYGVAEIGQQKITHGRRFAAQRVMMHTETKPKQRQQADDYFGQKKNYKYTTAVTYNRAFTIRSLRKKSSSFIFVFRDYDNDTDSPICTDHHP